jgi:hypothetical protein
VTSVQVTSNNDLDEVTRITAERDDFYTTPTFDEKDADEHFAREKTNARDFATNVKGKLGFKRSDPVKERHIREHLMARSPINWLEMEDTVMTAAHGEEAAKKQLFNMMKQ